MRSGESSVDRAYPNFSIILPAIENQTFIFLAGDL
jgi:hypothetical protein